MRWWDRRLRKVADRYTTMKVRIAVGTSAREEKLSMQDWRTQLLSNRKPQHLWSAAGGSGMSDEAARFLVTSTVGESACVSWGEVEVLVPKEPTAVGTGVLEGWEPPPQQGSSPHPLPPPAPQGSRPAHHTAEAHLPSPSRGQGSQE